MLLFIRIIVVHLGLMARNSITCGIRPEFKFLIFVSVIQSVRFTLLSVCFLICKIGNHKSNNTYLCTSDIFLKVSSLGNCPDISLIL